MSGERSVIAALTELARNIHEPQPLDALLQQVVDTAAFILGTDRASIRLLDPSRDRLLARARAGTALHADPNLEFKRGEGLLGWIVAARKPILTPDAEADPRFAQRPDRTGVAGSFLGVPLMSANVCLGVLSAIKARKNSFTQHDLELLTLLGAMCAPHIEIARLSRLYQVDSLTGALNRHGLDSVLPPEASPTALPEQLSVVLVDIDTFKPLNDQHGHALGDEVLKAVAAALQDTVRRGDSVVRLGGDEFMLVLPGAPLDRAVAAAERARAAVSQVQVPGTSVRVTISAGAAERREGESREALIDRADQALYRAKRMGRDRVERA